LAAVSQDSRAFYYASDELKGDRDMILAAENKNDTELGSGVLNYFILKKKFFVTTQLILITKQLIQLQKPILNKWRHVKKLRSSILA